RRADRRPRAAAAAGARAGRSPGPAGRPGAATAAGAGGALSGRGELRDSSTPRRAGTFPRGPRRSCFLDADAGFRHNNIAGGWRWGRAAGFIPDVFPPGQARRLVSPSRKPFWKAEAAHVADGPGPLAGRDRGVPRLPAPGALARAGG